MHAVAPRQDPTSASAAPSDSPAPPQPRESSRPRAPLQLWAPSQPQASPHPQASSRPTEASLGAGQLPPAIRAAVWRADALGSPAGAVLSSGWPELDRELPGGGWPTRSLTELLSPQSSVLEWRLLGSTLRGVVATDQTIVLVGPPKTPHLPGLLHCGLDERHLVWIAAGTPAERLWCTEQLVKANAAGALLAWLPQARPEQIRRLQACAQACEGLVFLFRPQQSGAESSAAPLRVQASPGPGWTLQVRLLKRRGAMLDATLVLPSVPGGLGAVLIPRLTRTDSFISRLEDAADAVGSPVIARRKRSPAAAC